MSVRAPADRAQSLLQLAHQALGRGAWEDARRGFTDALAEQEGPEALEGLGLAAWWLDDAAAVFDARERAYRLYVARCDRRGAGRVAMSLAQDAIYFRGQPAVARGWLGRARELLAGGEPIPEHGWLQVVAGDLALMVDGDTAQARRCADEAAVVGRALGQPDLAWVARALEGVSLVRAGRVAEGMPQLDEVATAALHGEVADPLAIGICCCYLMIACEHVRDLDRAAQWCDEIQRFCEQWRFNGVLALCRTQYAAVLISRGQWAEAERELEHAIPGLGASRPALRREAVVRLAALRRRQGRLDEAQTMLLEVEGHPLALLEQAALALDRGDCAESARVAERFLHDVARDNHSDRAAGIELLARAQVALAHTAAAAESLARLEASVGEEATSPVRGMLAAARGVVAEVSGDHRAAISALEEAVVAFARSGASFDAARVQIELAGALHVSGDVSGAVREAKAAQEILRGLGARVEAERAGMLLRELERPIPSTAGRPDGLTAREVAVLRLIAEGRSNQEVARALFVSEFTIKRHVANILTKLELRTRAAAAAYAARKGLL
jgi:LuxR family maltose regulon positive regulatory protein